MTKSGKITLAFSMLFNDIRIAWNRQPKMWKGRQANTKMSIRIKRLPLFTYYVSLKFRQAGINEFVANRWAFKRQKMTIRKILFEYCIGATILPFLPKSLCEKE